MNTKTASAAEHAALVKRLRAEGRHHLADAIEAGAAYEAKGVRLLPPKDHGVQRAAGAIVVKPTITWPASDAPTTDAGAELVALAARQPEADEHRLDAHVRNDLTASVVETTRDPS